MGFPCCSFFPPSCCCSREESNSLSWPYKDRNPCMGRLIVLKSIHRLTLIQPACLFFGMRLLPAVIAASSNHCVLSAGKASRDSPCWQNTIAMQEASPPPTHSVIFFPSTRGGRREHLIHLWAALVRIRTHLYGCGYGANIREQINVSFGYKQIHFEWTDPSRTSCHFTT